MRRGLCFFFLAVFCAPLCANEPDAKPTDKEVAEFADRLMAVTNVVHEDYYLPVSQGRLIGWAVRGLYRRCFGADAPDEIEERLQDEDGMKPDELRQLLTDVRQDVRHGALLGGRYWTAEIGNDRYFDLALEEMCKHLDETEVLYGGRRFNTERLPPLVGVGVRLRRDPATGRIEVVTPIMDGPAYRAGVRGGDFIQEITLFDQPDGQELKEPKVISANGLSAAAVLRVLKGQAGTKVGLAVRQPGEAKAKEFELSRSGAEEEAVVGALRKPDDQWDYGIDAKERLAYVRVARFADSNLFDARDTAADLLKAITALQKEEIRGLVLDLRFNKSAALAGVVDSAELFLKRDRVITSIRRWDRDPEEFRTRRDGKFLDLPLVCLVNGETAGGAEVFAACLQDHQRAVVMGERTAGECSVRTLRLLVKWECELRLTRASFFRPAGGKLYKGRMPGFDDDEWGVRPDPKYLLNLTAEDRRRLADHLDSRTYLLPPDPYGKNTEAPFKDRQLEMALVYLRSRGDKP